MRYNMQISLNNAECYLNVEKHIQNTQLSIEKLLLIKLSTVKKSQIARRKHK